MLLDNSELLKRENNLKNWKAESNPPGESACCPEHGLQLLPAAVLFAFWGYSPWNLPDPALLDKNELGSRNASRAWTLCSVQLSQANRQQSHHHSNSNRNVWFQFFRVSTFYNLLIKIIRNPLKYPIYHSKFGWLVTLSAVMGLGHGCCQA